MAALYTGPKKHSGKSYNKWLGDKKKLSHRERICFAIDDALAQTPKSFEALLELLKKAGYQVKDGKVPSLLGGDQKRFLCMNTLGEAYSLEALRAILKGSRKHIPKAKLVEELVDVPAENLIELMQATLNANNGAGRSRIQKVIALSSLHLPTFTWRIITCLIVSHWKRKLRKYLSDTVNSKDISSRLRIS